MNTATDSDVRRVVLRTFPVPCACGAAPCVREDRFGFFVSCTEFCSDVVGSGWTVEDAVEDWNTRR